MHQLTIETRVKHGQLQINHKPFADDTEVKVVVILSFPNRVWEPEM